MAEQSREVLFEFRRIGASVKVSAIDPQSGTEVSIVGPASAGEAQLRRVALQKLQFIMSRHAKS